MIPVSTEPKYRQEEEKESGRQGCLVCVMRTGVRVRAELGVFSSLNRSLCLRVSSRVAKGTFHLILMGKERLGSTLMINECGGKRSGPGQPIVAGPQGAAAR